MHRFLNRVRGCGRMTQLARVVLASACLGAVISVPVHADVFCVGTAIELQTALENAEDNTTNDFIYVQQGSYSGNFSFGSHEAQQLTIQGGWDATCATWVDDPSLTVLDAGGSGTVLSLYQHAGGGVQVESLTLQNGGYHGLWIRLINEFLASSIGPIKLIHNVIKDGRTKSGVYMMSEPGDAATAGNILIDDNVITGNYGERSGITVSASWSLSGSFIVFRNNLIAGNVSTDTAGGVTVYNYDTGDLYFTNNTIVDNATLASISIVGGVDLGIGTAFYAYNNIIQGNSSEFGADDLDVFYYGAGSSGTGFNNVYDDMNGTWHVEGSNQSLDPGLVARGTWHDNGTPGAPADDYWVDGDYHLGPVSPCIDAGSHGAPGPGTLPVEDFEGDLRVLDGTGDGVATVDIGADELAHLFVDGFESGGTSAWSETVGDLP